MRKSRGFTLIELLVVIAVIALLLALFMPALQRAKKQTRTVTCQANLKHWGLVLAAYTGDNNDHFFSGVLNEQWNDWIEILEPFSRKTGGLTCCPLATKTPERGGIGAFAAWKDKEGDYGSYGLSAWVCNANPGAVFGDERYWRIPNVAGAQNVPVFMDCRGISGWPDHSSVPPSQEAEPPATLSLAEQMKNFCINRHNAAVNSLFMDWSVRKVGLKELWALKWHREFNTSGSWTKAGGVQPDAWPAWMRGFEDF